MSADLKPCCLEPMALSNESMVAAKFLSDTPDMREVAYQIQQLQDANP